MGDAGRCAACGHALVPGSRFCGKCGARQAPVQRSGGGVWKIAFLLAAVIAAGALAWIFFLREKPVPRRRCPGGVCPKVGAGGGHLVVEGTGGPLDRVALDVGAGAVKEPIDIKISVAPPDARPPRVADPWNEVDPTLAGPIIRLEPDGQVFLEAVVLTLPFDPALIPEGRGIAVITWGNGHAERHEPSFVDIANRLIEVETTHFSDAVVVVDPGPMAIFVDGTMPIGPPGKPPLLGPTTEPPDFESCDKALAAVKKSLEQGAYRIYNDPSKFWAERGVVPGERTMLWYLYAEDGGAMSSIVDGSDQPIKPIRTGYEVDMYKQLKAQLTRDPGSRITPDMLLDMALRAANRGGSANYADAVVTALNVVRALARADKWMGDLIDMKGGPCPPDHVDCGYDPKVNKHFGHPPSDPMMPIFRDVIGAQSIDGGKTFYEMLGGRLGHPEAQFVMKAFDPKKGMFAPLAGAESYIHNGGAHYYHWTGAVGQVFAGGVATAAGAAVEFTVTKLPSDPEAGIVQTNELLRGRELAECIQSRPPEPPPPVEPPPCPPLTKAAVKCPWSPDGYTVGECPPGFCWDAGPQGSLACKQIETPPGAGRNDLNNIVCGDGMVPLGHDRCTGLHTGCGAASAGPSPTTP